ncbi:MAG: hypothetical protein AB7N24_19255 [Dehalococcoidia bacterium]
MTQPASAREAAERNAEAIMSGNLSQLMADITPDVLAQVMAMGSQAGGLSPAQMPNIQGYDIKDFGPDGDVEVFHVTFRSDIGTATISESWKQLMGQWKITAVSLISAEAATPPE